MPNTLDLFDIPIHYCSHQQILQAIEDASWRNLVRIATVNPEIILYAKRHPEYRPLLTGMTHCTIDGSGLLAALKMYRKSEGLELVHGADLVPELFHKYSAGQKSFYLIGGKEGIAQRVANHFQKLCPDLKIVGAADGGMIPVDPELTIDSKYIEEIRLTRPDIILVGMGAPRQEYWIKALSKVLAVPVMIGVGGTFDFYSTKKRAPHWMRRLHLEWLYRSIYERGHWKRSFQATVVFSLTFAMWLTSKAFRGTVRR